MLVSLCDYSLESKDKYTIKVFIDQTFVIIRFLKINSKRKFINRMVLFHFFFLENVLCLCFNSNFIQKIRQMDINDEQFSFFPSLFSLSSFFVTDFSFCKLNLNGLNVSSECVCVAKIFSTFEMATKFVLLSSVSTLFDFRFFPFLEFKKGLRSKKEAI